MVEIGQVLLAAPRSFCAGVDRAIEIVEILLEQHGPPVYVRHQIVHNDHVVRRLEGLGAVFVDHEDEIPAGAICVLSAHGVAPSVRANCEARGLRVVDAVCPLVSKVHAEARRYADSGHLVALVGHADHVEVIGTRGERPEADGRDRVARGRGEARLRRQADRGDHADDALARRRRRDGRRAGRALRRSASRPAADDICYATQNRQDAVKELAKQGATLILVIGSETSSNARRLVEVAERHGATALLIDGESGLDPDLLAGHETVGLTAGASTPEELVALVLRGLASVGYDELGEVEVARENVQLPPPEGGRTGGQHDQRRGSRIRSPSALPSLTVLDITNEVRRELSGAGLESGIAYVSPLDDVALVRVQERESGFFADLEDLLTRLVPQEEPERERLLCMLLGPRGEQIPFAGGDALSRPVAADPAARLRPPLGAALEPDPPGLGMPSPARAFNRVAESKNTR